MKTNYLTRTRRYLRVKILTQHFNKTSEERVLTYYTVRLINKKMKASAATTKLAFEAGCLLCFFLAFASLLSEGQFDGLYGMNGILPMNELERALDGKRNHSISELANVREFIKLYGFNICWFSQMFGVRFSAFMKSALVLSTLVSFGAFVMKITDGTKGSRRNSFITDVVVFSVLVIVYGSMIDVGDAFLSFQWDFLLIECGIACIVGSVLFASSSDLTREEDSLYAWIPRAILFKLMLMSGAVKILSDCPTWLKMTALDYHFATQPLPAPLSKYVARALSSNAKKIGVAITYIVEGPLAFTILAPTKSFRRFTCLCQVLFQIGIILTGNYAFFNYLTIVLAVSSAIAGERKLEKPRNSEDKKSDRKGIEKNKAKAMPMLQHSLTMIGNHLALIFVTLCAVNLFAPNGIKKDGIIVAERTIKLRWDKKNASKKLAKFLDFAVPIARTYLILIAVPLNFAYRLVFYKTKDGEKDGNNTKKKTARWLIRTVRDLLLMAYLLVLTAPIGENALGKKIGKKPEFFLSQMNNKFLDTTTKSIQQLIPSRSRISSSYGLFRRMTGVGKKNDVARREIVIEIAADADSANELIWHELEFKHKPGNVSKQPSYLAPHQPRLDWQMWFAALRGDDIWKDNHYRWFSWLVLRILQKSPEVAKLFDPQMSNYMKNTTYLRIKTYEYDFAPLEDSNIYVRKYIGLLLPPTALEDENMKGLRKEAGDILKSNEGDFAWLNIPELNVFTFAISIVGVFAASKINSRRRRKRGIVI